MQAITNFYELQNVQLLHQKNHREKRMVKRDNDYSMYKRMLIYKN